jgi:CheY-like chemotaxis protein
VSDNNEDELLFAKEQAQAAEMPPPDPRVRAPWKVLVVDDEQQIHTVTKMVLSNFSFRDQGLEFISAYSAEEARGRISEHPDIAVAFIDVVMETDTAGLDLVRHIRENLKNRHMRIVLRTGQPGQAPERKVIVGYDINDYKEKSELTAQKLFSTMVTALRSYKDIMTIETSRRGLEKIIESSSSLFRIRSMKTFLSGILLQLGSLLEMSVDSVLVSALAEANGARPNPKDMRIVAASGRFSSLLDALAQDNLEPVVWANIQRVLDSQNSVFHDDHSIVYFHSLQSRDTVVYIETVNKLEDMDHRLIQLFCANASIGLDNLS